MQKENKIIPFGYGDSLVRVVENEKTGESLWVAKDICDVLEYKNPRDAISKLDDDERGMSEIPTPSGIQNMNVINESGLYTLILRSNKPEAKKFKKWVTAEVLPTIRKTGSYSISQNQDLQPFVIEILKSNQEMVKSNQQIIQAIFKMSENQEALFKTALSTQNEINRMKSQVDRVENKTETIREITIRADIVAKDTYNYLKHQPLTREERVKLVSKITKRGKKLSDMYDITLENAIAAIYRSLNKAYSLTSYHELDRNDFVSAYDFVEYVDIGKGTTNYRSNLKHDLEDTYSEDFATNAKDIYGNKRN